MSEERLMILKMIQDGKITPEQGESLLKALPLDTGEARRPSPPAAPSPSIPPIPPLGSFFDLQGRLADVQVKLGELQSKLGAANGSSSSASTAAGGKNTVLPFGLGEVNVGQMIDEAVRGVNSLKSESVKTFKQAARTAQKEGRKIRDEAKKSGKNIRIELNINFDDDGRPHNEANAPESVTSEEIPLIISDGSALSIINKMGDVKVTTSSTSGAQLRFTRTTWSNDEVELAALNAVRPAVSTGENGQTELIVIDDPSVDNDHLTIDLEILLPETVTTHVETTFGDVSVENRVGGIGKIESISGDVRILNVRGPANNEGLLRTRSGSVSIRQWTGPSLSIDSTSGNVEGEAIQAESITARSRSGELSFQNVTVTSDLSLEAASGDVSMSHTTIGKQLNVRTQSGDIHSLSTGAVTVKLESVSGDMSLQDVSASDGGVTVKSVSGDLLAKEVHTSSLISSTVSGDIDLKFKDIFTGVLNASTISGDVDLFLNPGSDSHLELTTQTGSLRSDIELNERGTNGSRFISGNIGSGHGSIILQTVSGDVTVKPLA